MSERASEPLRVRGDARRSGEKESERVGVPCGQVDVCARLREQSVLKCRALDTSAGK